MKNIDNVNEAPIIRKGSHKDYLNMGIYGGFVVGVMWFLISLIEQHVISALLIGLYVWIGMIVFFVGIGFPYEEYYRRKKRIQRLKSEKYLFLHENSFQIHSDLFFEGTYREYFIRILPMTKWQNNKRNIEYDIIEAFYTFDSEKPEEKEAFLTGEYYWGYLCFSNHYVEYLPKDWRNPNFKENLDGLINILNRGNLKPLSQEEWNNSFGKRLKEQVDEDEKARTIQIFKIGKLLDIKYVKNGNG